MAKQIKLGLDKTAAPSYLKTFPVFDVVSGTILTDVVGNPLVTEQLTTASEFLLSRTALSVHINNEPVKVNIPVEEQFPTESENSTSLLGIPRNETQLSLYSDVSTYGLDTNNWEYASTLNVDSFKRRLWFSKNNPRFGKRSFLELIEDTQEQALSVKGYPTNYSEPAGPSSREYNQFDYRRYLNFLILGKMLFNHFLPINERFARKNFISDKIKIVDSKNVPISEESFDVNILQEDSIPNILIPTAYDVIYPNSQNLLNQAYTEIESFDIALNFIRDVDFITPDPNFYSIGGVASRVNTNAGFLNPIPGGTLGIPQFASLDSKQSFRYQTGRISGFTFGTKIDNDPSDVNTIIEWGCFNSTDQYMFQLRGSSFSIVRRSEIPLFRGEGGQRMVDRFNKLITNEDLLFSVTDEKTNVQSPELAGSSIPGELFELVIKREQFNGDSLDGNGPSGYAINLQDVTMYKIEFGWYGAIGAKFYVYIPVGNDESRWVLVHTLVIENGLNKPCLVDPNFKFRYSIDINNIETIKRPLGISKYGSSYYIDGGDDGNSKYTSVFTSKKPIGIRTPLVGILPKRNLINRNGNEVKNKGKTFIEDIHINTNDSVSIEVYKIDGSYTGHHFSYSPSLHQELAGERVKKLKLKFNEDRNQVTITSSNTFSASDYGSKIIAEGVYNTYIGNVVSDDSKTAEILRRDITNSRSNELAENFYALRSIGTNTNDNVVPPGRNNDRVTTSFDSIVFSLSNTEVDALLTNYKTVAASTTPIKTSIFRIYFLNPLDRYINQTFGNVNPFCDFVLGISGDNPISSNLDSFTVNTNRMASIEQTPVIVATDSQLQNAEEFENQFNTLGGRFIQDEQLSEIELSGVDTGSISVIKVKKNIIEKNVTAITGSGPYVITVEADLPFDSVLDINKESIGVNGVGVLITDITKVEENGQIQSNITTNVDITAISDGSTIQIKEIVIEDDTNEESAGISSRKAFTWETNNNIGAPNVRKEVPFYFNDLYLYVGMQEKAKINNILIEEQINETKRVTKTPKWITNVPGDTVVVLSGNVSENSIPPNFESVENPSSFSRVDLISNQNLRPGTRIASFYADTNTTKIDMKKIFSQDREIITPGKLNNTAYYITATNISGNTDVTAEISFTLKEQQ